MADPVVGITNGVPTSGTGTITTLGQTILDQAASGAAVPANVKMAGLSDGTNSQRWLTALALGDGVNGNNTGAVAGWMFNGTTWDRARGDATNGYKVQVWAAGSAITATSGAIDVNIKSGSGLNTNGQKNMAGSAPSVLPNDMTSIPVAFDTSQIYNGAANAALTPTKVKINVASATTTTLVPLVTSKKIRIVSMYIFSTAANTVTLQSHTTTTNTDGGLAYAANSGMVLPFNPLGWFDSTAGEALDMVTLGAGQVSGQLAYVAV